MIRISTNRGILYSQKRLILLNYKDFLVKSSFDFNRILAHLFFKLGNRKLYRKYFYLFKTRGIKGDAFHFFNTVTNSSRPWIVTMEADFNRFQNNRFNPFKYLESNSCKYILPYSQWSLNNQLCKINDETLKEKISKKMKVIYPPQQVLVNSHQAELNKPVKFILVGGEFFRKGGYEALKVFEQLDNEEFKFEFTIISKLHRGDFPVDATEEMYAYTVNQIKTKSYINYFESLPNEEVLTKIKEHNVGILISHLETFGYFVLECQASGVPVITTSQRAFLEINSEERGWLVQVPINSNLSIEYDTKEKRNHIQKLIEKRFYGVAKEILQNPDQISIKSENSINYIKEYHSLNKYKIKLAEIYKEITRK